MRRDIPSKKAQRNLKPWIGAVITGLALTGCGQQAAGPQLPADAPHALVLGAVNSPVYDELGKSVRMTPYDGSQKAADNDLVILDGDTNTPQAVQSHSLVREALRAGKAVLLVDATEAHKREGLGKYLGFASKDGSPGYLARLTYDQNGRAEVRVVDFRSPETLKFSGDVAAKPVGGLTPGAASAFTRRALATLGVPRVGVQDGYSPYPCGGQPDTASLASSGVQDDTNEIIPAGAIYKHVFYCVPVQWQTGGTYSQPGGSQNSYYDTQYTFTLILDNGNEPQGNFQWLAAQADVTANPSGTPDSGAQPILSNSGTDKGWFQDRIKLNLAPADMSLFSSVSDSPANANNVTQVTTGFGVTVSASASDPNVQANYSNSQTVNLPDWQVTNNSVGDTKAWDFKSVNPIDADHLSGGFTSFGNIKTPNGLSLNQLQFGAQAAWRTGTVLTEWVDFNASSEQDVADLGIVCRYIAPNDRTCDNKTASGANGAPVTLSLYIGAVVPVPIQAISFSQNPAPVVTSGQVTGNIVLASPAPEDISIPLTSTDPAHASVPPSVTVKQGDLSANFTVNIASNGLAPGKTATAQIAAFYAQNYQGALNVQGVASDVWQPTTAPGYDNGDWYENAPQGSRWVVGYQVRYAVSFVDASGNETGLGPWSDWFSGNYTDGNGNPQAFVEPTLTGIATDPTGKAVARNVYRQFLVDYSSTDFTAGVTKVITLNDNTTTSAPDTNAPQ